MTGVYLSDPNEAWTKTLVQPSECMKESICKKARALKRCTLTSPVVCVKELIDFPIFAIGKSNIVNTPAISFDLQTLYATFLPPLLHT